MSKLAQRQEIYRVLPIKITEQEERIQHFNIY